MRETSEIIKDMIQIDLAENQSFLVVKETLSRIGLPNAVKRIIYPSTHILQKQGNYYIAHFKTLLELDGKEAHLDQDDRERLADIAVLMSTWGLVTLVDKPNAPSKNRFRVLKKHELDAGWTIQPKFTIGKFKSGQRF